MEKFVVASIGHGAGKTSVIVGLAEALKKKVGYMKPFGDRPIYRGKELWDYDVALMTELYGLKDKPEDMCLGFDHSELNYAYRKKGVTAKLLESVASVSKGKRVLLIEGGKNMRHGTYVHLGAMSLAKHTGAKLVVVVTGNNDSIVDDVAFLKKYLAQSEVKFAGVIINKLTKPGEFKEKYLPEIKGLGIDVLGMLPYNEEFTYLPVGYLAEALSAKVVTGEDNLNRVVKNILVGAMTVDLPLQKILAERRDKLMITSGDRSDMILAALDSDTDALVLTNNILPPSNIISKAEDQGVPMLLVPYDTYKTARQIDTLEPLLTKDDKGKIKLLGKMAKENLNLKKFGK